MSCSPATGARGGGSEVVTGRPALVRTAHASGLHAVERELARLHREILRAGADVGRMVRLSTLTLVAACVDDDGCAMAEASVSRIVESHPARVIIVVAEPQAGGAEIAADLALQCSERGGGQVWAEQVRLHVRGEPALHLRSVVSPLLLPDVPVHLWLVGAPRLEQALDDEVADMCERIVVDSAAYTGAAATLATLAGRARAGSRLRSALCDLAWIRLRPWRELVAQAFDGADMRGFLDHVTSATITAAGERASSHAWLLAGWLGAGLGWEGDGGDRVAVTHTAGEGPAGLAAIQLECRAGGRTARVRLEGTAAGITTSIDVPGGVSVGGTVPVADPDVPSLVGGVLQEGAPDAVYGEALSRAAALAGGL